jgi:hypothetical protein
MRRKWGWHNNSVNGEIKSQYVRANLPGSEKNGTGTDQKGRSARGQKKRFLVIVIGMHSRKGIATLKI